MAQRKEELRAIGFKNGLYLGIGLSLLTLVALLVNWDILLNPWFQFLKLIITVSIATWATYLGRKSFPQQFAFKDGFSAFFITIAVGLIIFALSTWFLYNYAFVDAGRYINETSIKMREAQLKALDQDPENIQREIEMLKESFQFSFINQLKGYVNNLILYCLLAPIIALIFKTKNPILK